MSIKIGTQLFDVLGYTCEFAGSVTADQIAYHVGTEPHAVRVAISRLRKLGLVEDGSPYNASKQGKEDYESALFYAGIKV